MYYEKKDDHVISFKSSEPQEIEQLKQDNADQDFYIMELEAKTTQQEQELADINFNLMIGGII